MMLIKPANMDDPNFLRNARSSVAGFPNTFIVGCHLYSQAQFDKAANCF